MKRVLFIGGVLLLAGCASAPDVYDVPASRDVPSVEKPSRGDEPEPAPTEQAPRRNAAAVALAGRARGAFRQGKLAQAARTLERALTIAPADAGAWLMLGWVRLAQKQPQQAAALAARVRSLTPTHAQQCLGRALARAAEAGHDGWPRAWRLFQRARSRCMPRAV